MGYIERTFDRGAKGFPVGYKHDLVLVRPNDSDLQMDPGKIELRSFHSNPLSLRYNELLLLLNEGEAVVKDGRALSHTAAITIGQAFFKNLQRHVPNVDPAQENVLDEQFSSSYIWRTYGNFRSLQGCSGSPLVADTGEILGFQNWEWQGPFLYRQAWAETDESIMKQEEGRSNATAATTMYPFYGSYQLPSIIKSSRIATKLEFM